MNIKKELLTKIHQLPGNPSYMGIVDLILSEEVLKILLPMYEVDEVKTRLFLRDNEDICYITPKTSLMMLTAISSALSQSDVIKVKELKDGHN